VIFSGRSAAWCARKGEEMQKLRTPEECFLQLPGFSLVPNYLEDLPGCGSLRVHYIDAGPVDADKVWLCLHGQPAWSYLYRKMIPVFVKAGNRVLVPDLIGFGRSDKPVEESVYTFAFHRTMLLSLIDRLDLRNIVLVCQDWGGLLGLTLPMSRPDRFSALLVMNTMLGTGDFPLSEGFLAWRTFVRNRPDFDIAALMRRSCPGLSAQEAEAYAAPFPDDSYRAGVRRFPELVPDHLNAPGAALSREARGWWHNEWQGDSLMVIGMQDPVLGPQTMGRLHSIIRHCPPPLELPEAGHFVQEWGESVAERAVLAFRQPNDYRPSYYF
jgi:haloalkane dehalogenase